MVRDLEEGKGGKTFRFEICNITFGDIHIRNVYLQGTFHINGTFKKCVCYSWTWQSNGKLCTKSSCSRLPLRRLDCNFCNCFIKLNFKRWQVTCETWIGLQSLESFDLVCTFEKEEKRIRSIVCTSVQFPIHCALYISTVQKKFSTKAYISWQYRKKYIFPCFALVTVQSSWDIRRTRSELWRRTIQKNRSSLFWEPLLKTEVIFAFVYHGGVYFCMAARLSTDAMPFWDPLVEKNCHGQKLLLRIRCSFSCYTFTDDRLLIGSLAKLPGWKKR